MLTEGEYISTYSHQSTKVNVRKSSKSAYAGSKVDLLLGEKMPRKT